MKMNITQSIKYVGVNDRSTDLFEGQYKIPNGISYNSYVIIDDKCAVMDSVDAHFADEWLGNIENALVGRSPDYLVVQHMEPDHSGSLSAFTERYPDAVIVASEKAFVMMRSFFGKDYIKRGIPVKDNFELSLGSRTLKFISAPMVHWPEVILTYSVEDGVLFSADAFGKFGVPKEGEPWVDEARRYYIGIVGKYGAPVQNLIHKIKCLQINTIAPLHGPVLNDSICDYLSLYDTWSSYRPEAHGVTIAYASIYGNTKAAAELLYSELTKSGVRAEIYDLARCDMSEAIASAFKYDTLVLASATYNADVFPPMRAFLHGLVERGYSKRRVALIENGSWAPAAAKVMRSMLEGQKEISFIGNEVKITSALNDASCEAIIGLSKEICK